MSNARTYGTIHSEQKPFVIQHANSTDYLLGGSLVMKNGKIDKYLFEGGYAQATSTSKTTDSFAFNYYNQDHLGNNREVVDASGVVTQVTNYYPFGAPYADATASKGADVQPYKYNGKELDLMHGLNTYDYGARQYDPILARWDRMDPLCEKYYNVSPYNYCVNNPVNAVDPDGNLTIFINGMHNGFEGADPDYWNYFDTNFLAHFKDTKNAPKYYDGSVGGIFNIDMNMMPLYRFLKGYRQGQKDIANIIQKLGRENESITEKLRIVTHSMGAAYGKGFIKAILEYIKLHPKICQGLSLDVYDFAPFQSYCLSGSEGVETFQYYHFWDLVAHDADEKGDVHHMRTSLNMQDGHSIDSFQQYINSLPEGTYKYVNGQWVKIK